jgi:protein-S-isoprenylcysteine O-methyltransferase Ste14
MALGSYGLISKFNLFFVESDLISERMQFGGQGVNRRDQLVAFISFVFLYLIPLVVAGLDRGRFGWTQNIPLAIKIAGLVVFILGNFLERCAISSNRYFSTFVRIQKDRGHQVVTRGPYRFIRHPGYAGAILSQLVLPIVLGSWLALIPAIIGGMGFILRTALEDRELIDHLDGYRQYSDEVRWCLLPGVW